MVFSYSFQQSFFGCLSLFCTVIGFPVNMIALFSNTERRKNSASKILFSCITTVDGVLCLLMIPVCLSNFGKGHPVLFQYQPICEGWSYLWGCFSRISIFLIGLLNLLRTNSLLNPLRPWKRDEIAVPMVVYIVLIAIQGTVPWWYKVPVHYMKSMPACAWILQDLFKNFNMVEQYIYYVVTYLMEFVFPVFPITISCVVSVLRLRHRPLNGSPETSRQNKRQATRMIIALTIVYICFNIPYCIVLTLDSIGLMSQNRFTWSMNVAAEDESFIYNFIYIHTIALNSTVDAIIYTAKMFSLRKTRNEGGSHIRYSSNRKADLRSFGGNSMNMKRLFETSIVNN